jgi:hypothetical protein
MKKRWLLGVPAALLLGPVGYWVWTVNASEIQARKIVFEYQVPSGFTGWITVKSGVPQAPPIPFVPDGLGGKYTFRIPPSGLLETSSPPSPRRHTAKYLWAEHGGAVLIGWEPPPHFLREVSTVRCVLIFVPQRALAHDQEPPPYPDHGC